METITQKDILEYADELAQFNYKDNEIAVFYRQGFIDGAKWARHILTEHKELTLTLDNGEIKPAADGK